MARVKKQVIPTSEDLNKVEKQIVRPKRVRITEFIPDKERFWVQLKLSENAYE